MPAHSCQPPCRTFALPSSTLVNTATMSMRSRTGNSGWAPPTCRSWWCRCWPTPAPGQAARIRRFAAPRLLCKCSRRSARHQPLAPCVFLAWPPQRCRGILFTTPLRPTSPLCRPLPPPPCRQLTDTGGLPYEDKLRCWRPSPPMSFPPPAKRCASCVCPAAAAAPAALARCLGLLPAPFLPPLPPSRGPLPVGAAAPRAADDPADNTCTGHA